MVYLWAEPVSSYHVSDKALRLSLEDLGRVEDCEWKYWR